MSWYNLYHQINRRALLHAIILTGIVFIICHSNNEGMSVSFLKPFIWSSRVSSQPCSYRETDGASVIPYNSRNWLTMWRSPHTFISQSSFPQRDIYYRPIDRKWNLQAVIFILPLQSTTHKGHLINLMFSEVYISHTICL